MTTLTEHLCTALAAHLNKPHRPALPAGGALLWRWFVDLSSARTWGMAGPDPISLEAIDVYRRLTGWPIEERHIRTLREMDEVFRRHCKAAVAEPTTGSRPLSAALFDATFR